MLDPYEGEGGYGLPTLSLEELSALVREANRWGLPVAVHAIGDAGNRAVLDALAAHGDKGLRNRIEHVQLLNSADIPRLAELNIVASMQPIQCPQDRYMADRYWGGRSRWAYPFQSLLRQGTHLAFGSDAPVEEADVLKGMYSAVARKRWDEPETEPWYGEEAVSMWDALRAFTYGGAYAAGEEDYRGVLAPGMLADFTVLTQDILAAAAQRFSRKLVLQQRSWRENACTKDKSAKEAVQGLQSQCTALFIFAVYWFDCSGLSRWIKLYTMGTTNRIRIVELVSPPMTVTARARWNPRLAPTHGQRHHAQDGGDGGHENGPQPYYAGFPNGIAYVDPSRRRWFMKSTKTMALFTTIPTSTIIPIMEIIPMLLSVIHRPKMDPMRAKEWPP